VEIVVHGAYLASVVMFMLALQRMGRVRTARQGNTLAAGAMLLAVVRRRRDGRIDPSDRSRPRRRRCRDAAPVRVPMPRMPDGRIVKRRAASPRAGRHLATYARSESSSTRA
jgi:hypothetical protein